jgi:tetratricopeptide (TPR) repeat protein
MTWMTIRALAAALLIGAAAVPAVGIVANAPAMAATIKTPAVAKLMKDAQAAARAGNWHEALAKAQQASGIAQGGESIVVTQFIAYAATNAGAYSVALNAYDRLIAAGAVNRTEGLKTALRLAIRANEPQRAMQYANQLGGADPMLVAQLQFQSGNYREVIRLLSGQLRSPQPSRDALVLLQNSYYKIGDRAGTMRVLEILALTYPSPESWHEILRVAQNERGLPDRGLLEVYRMRLAVDDLKSHDDFSEMAQVALEFGLAAEAKSVLDKAVALHLLAGDRDQRLVNVANAALAKDAANMARLHQEAAANPHDGNAEIQLAEILWNYGKYPEAEQAVRRGITEGNLKDPDAAKIVLGHILFSQGRRQEASTAFASVSPTGKLASVGRLWSLYARSR